VSHPFCVKKGRQKCLRGCASAACIQRSDEALYEENAAGATASWHSLRRLPTTLERLACAWVR